MKEERARRETRVVEEEQARELRIRQGESEDNEDRQRPGERINWSDVEGDGHFSRGQSGEDLGGGDLMYKAVSNSSKVKM